MTLSRPTLPLKKTPTAFRVSYCGTVGLKSDGTCLVSDTPMDVSNSLANIASWTGIAKLCSVGLYGVVGIRENGTCICHNHSLISSIEALTDVIDIDGDDNFVVALKADGTVTTIGSRSYLYGDAFSDYTDLVYIARTYSGFCALKSDGTILVTSYDGNEKMLEARGKKAKQISPSEFGLVVLNEDDTCSFYGTNYHGETACSSWTNVKKVVGTYSGILGIKNDNTLCIIDTNSANVSLASSATSVYDVSEESCHINGLIVINSDGTCTATEVGYGIKSEIDTWQLFSIPIYYLYKTTDAVWGYEDTTFKELTTSWDTMSNSDKVEMFENTSERQASLHDFNSNNITKFSIMHYSEGNTRKQAILQGVPKNQTITQKELIDLSEYECINSVTITSHKLNGGDVKVMVTKDGNTYYTFNGTEWVEKTLADIDTEGMSVTLVNALDGDAWGLLETKKIGFAYSLSMENVTDKADVDQLDLNVDMRGVWHKATHSTDYTYKYTSPTKLVVTLKNDGSYKINYVK